MMKLLICSVTKHTPQNKVGDTTSHMSLIITNVVNVIYCSFASSLHDIFF